MLTDHGLRQFLTALGEPYACRLWTYGSRIEQIFSCDQGYPKVDDQDEANQNRGSLVLTWRYTIPKGTHWGASPANEVELLDGEYLVDRFKIPDLTASQQYPTVLYLNMVLRRA